MYTQKRKVKNGRINLFGEKWFKAELEKYNDKEVELRSTGEQGFDIYYGNDFICYLKTIPDSLKTK